MNRFSGVGRYCNEDDDEEEVANKLTVSDVVEISLALNCPVKTKTVLKYAELIARQCRNQTKDIKSVVGMKGLQGIPGRPVSMIISCSDIKCFFAGFSRIERKHGK